MQDSFKTPAGTCARIDVTRIGLALTGPLLRTRWAVSYASTAYREYFRHRQWGVGMAAVPIQRFLDPGFRPEIQWVHAARRDEYLADPFGVVHQGRLRVLCELYRREAMRGTLVAFDWPKKGQKPDWKAVLPTRSHASYPFLFEHGGQTYCVPETSQAKEVSLYQADPFPHRWTKVATLLDDFAGVDNTVFRFDGRWWIASTDVNAPDRSLYLWYADHPEGPWEPHAKNPVLDSVSSARPAGTPFLANGNLYRPAQDSSKTYGGRVAINLVEELSPIAFRERVESFVEPDPKGPYPLGLHTLSSAGGVTLIDGFRDVFSKAGFRRKLAERPPWKRQPLSNV